MIAPKEGDVTADLVIANLMHNAGNASRIARAAIALIDQQMPASIAHNALTQGLITPLEKLPAEKRALVKLLLQ